MADIQQIGGIAYNSRARGKSPAFALGGGIPIPAPTELIFVPATTFQTLDGIGAEIQSDSIEGDGGGIQESNTKGLPFGLSASEQTRFADEILSVTDIDGVRRPFTYVRLALGLYYRGVTPNGRNFRQRITGQDSAMKIAMDRAGSKYAVLYWSPPPFYKKVVVGGTEYRGSTRPIPDKTNDPVGWNLYLREMLQGGSLDIPDKAVDPAGYDAKLESLADDAFSDMLYHHTNVGCVGLFCVQNEPSISHTYPTCVWTGEQSYDFLKKMMTRIRASAELKTYNGQPNQVLWYLDAENGQTGRGAGFARDDADLMTDNYGWAWHRITAMALDKNWARTNANALMNNLGKTTGGPSYPGRAFCDEYEFFDEFVDPAQARYLTDEQRFANIVSNAFRWFVHANARIHFWIHLGKNADGPRFEKKGRALSAWRAVGTAEPTDYPGLAEGAFALVKPNAHSNLALVRHIIKGSVRVNITEPAYDSDLAHMAFRLPDERHVFGVVNSGDTARRVTLATGGLRWRGKRYDASVFGSDRPQQTDIDTILPPYTAEFWTQVPTVPAQMAAPTLTVGNGSITVDRADVTSNGGSAITGYDVRRSTDGTNWTAVAMSSDPQTLTGLTNGTTYQVQTRANNAVGSGPWSPSATATPTSAIQPYSQNFDSGTNGADISTLPGITRVDGTAGHLTINSVGGVNANTSDASGTGYGLPTTGSQAQFAEAVSRGASNPGGPLVCVRFQNRDNFVGVRWSSTAYELVKKTTAGGAAILASSTGITPSAGQVVRIEIDASNNARVLVDGVQRIAPTAIAAASLTSETPGLVARSAIKQPWIDNVSSGPLP